MVSIRAMLDWLSNGWYYRMLAAAQSRDESEKFLRFIGDLWESHARELVESGYPAPRPAGGGRIFGDDFYGAGGGSRSSDVIIDFGQDVVMLEVKSGYLAHKTRTTGGVDDLERDLTTMTGSSLIPSSLALVQRRSPSISRYMSSS